MSGAAGNVRLPTAAEWLGRFPEGEPPIGSAGAAVTLVLRDGSTDVEVLLIERAISPEDPGSGQVALPGGRVATSDGSLTVTALRELQEEVGLAESDLTGPLRFVRTRAARRFGLSVAVFAAAIAPEAGPPVRRSPREVAHVFWFPQGRLAQVRWVPAGTDRPSPDVPAAVFEGHVIWGFTRRVLLDFFGYGAEQEPNP